MTFHSWSPRPAAAIRELAMMPTALIGEKLPAFPPFATISAVSIGGSCTRAPMTMASGTTSAMAGTAPGPTAENANVRMKNISGIRCTLLPTNRMERWLNASKVWLT